MYVYNNNSVFGINSQRAGDPLYLFRRGSSCARMINGCPKINDDERVLPTDFRLCSSIDVGGLYYLQNVDDLFDPVSPVTRARWYLHVF